jgi:hypothetical protein
LSEEKWITDCEEVLKRLKETALKKKRDRLDMLKSIRFSIRALQRSLMGWWQWANSPEMMSNFSSKELEDINKTIMQFVKSFIEYDVKITELGLKYKKEGKKENERIVV